MTTTTPPQFGRFAGWLSRRIQERIAPIPPTFAEINSGTWKQKLYWNWRLATALPFCVLLLIFRRKIKT